MAFLVPVRLASGGWLRESTAINAYQVHTRPLHGAIEPCDAPLVPGDQDPLDSCDLCFPVCPVTSGPHGVSRIVAIVTDWLGIDHPSSMHE